MWIDSHCHLDATEYDGASNVIADEARAADVSWIVVPAVERANFKTVAELATRCDRVLRLSQDGLVAESR